ncbi:glycosyltransferase [Candidatus Saccharibacteria bacterium]|nr:MAG: glycosyltransferase [Candidatus Saccharibacteria bacterium]
MGLKVGIVVPHIFMQAGVREHVIFSPGDMALTLAEGLQKLGVGITLFTPGPVETKVHSVTADLSYFEQELAGRGDTYTDLLKKHPFTFITLARQVQSELIAKAYAMANAGELDVVHIYTNEEDTALPFAELCTKPVVFTHHDPFNFLVKYKNVFPKYPQLNWISMSLAQRAGMPAATNWVGNVYHGISDPELYPVAAPTNDYVAYLGRIIEPKGVHLAIEAVKQYNSAHPDAPLTLKLAGKHYAGHKKDAYWTTHIEPEIDAKAVEYVGFIDTSAAKREFLGNAKALLVPSLFAEPFGLVSIEAFACGTPVIALDSGALPEVIETGKTGYIVPKILGPDSKPDEPAVAQEFTNALEKIDTIDRTICRATYEARFTADRMCAEHLAIYAKLA